MSIDVRQSTSYLTEVTVQLFERAHIFRIRTTEKEPDLYETMIFSNDSDFDVEFQVHSPAADAKATHKMVVDALVGGKQVPRLLAVVTGIKFTWTRALMAGGPG